MITWCFRNKYTIIASYFIRSLTIRILDTTLPTCAVERSNHYAIEIR